MLVMAAARSCSALPAQYINPVLPQGYYRDLQTESWLLSFVDMCENVFLLSLLNIYHNLGLLKPSSVQGGVNVSGAPPCLPGYLTPDRDRDSCISLCHALGGAAWALGRLVTNICNTRTQASSTRNIVGRGKLITKAEISEVTNVCFVQL